jgi:hypothetical protein
MAYLSLRKAMLSAVRNAATRESGLRRKPNPTIHNENIKTNTFDIFITKKMGH